MKTTLALLIVSLLPVFAGAQNLSAADALKPAARPNILISHSDDQGYADLGCQGSPDIPTSNNDSFAENGGRFTSASVTSSKDSSLSRGEFVNMGGKSK